MAPESAWIYLLTHRDEVSRAVEAHAGLSASALSIAALTGIPLGIWCAHNRTAAGTVISFVGAARVVPSLVVLTLMLPILGLGFAPSLVALAMLAFPPIVINTYVGFRDVDASVREAAAAMGMTVRQIVARVEAPIAFPIVVAGVRTASVEVIASATLATFIGGGGLGDLINNGLQLNDGAMLATGAVLVALMALVVEVALSGVARFARAA